MTKMIQLTLSIISLLIKLRNAILFSYANTIQQKKQSGSYYQIRSY
jgi:hypothetical protein